MNLPEWALDGTFNWTTKEMFGIGVRTEFEAGARTHWIEIYPPGDSFGRKFSLWFDGLIIASPETAPDAFRLAARLAASLEGKPCERCGVLETEVARLRKTLLAIRMTYGFGSSPGQSHDQKMALEAVIDAALTPDADAKGGEGDKL